MAYKETPIPKETLDRIAKGKVYTSQETLDFIAKKYMRRDTRELTTGVLDVFAFGSRKKHILIAAAHLNTKPETLIKLADYKRGWDISLLWASRVRATVALHPFLPEEAAIKLASSNDLKVMFNLAVRHYFGLKTYEEVRNIMAPTRGISIKRAIIDDPEISLETLRYLRDNDTHFAHTKFEAAEKIRQLFRRTPLE